ncbi:alpha/beta fold hydrolase [Saccharopolyspora sp. HNM0986]|uniref:alpha/beta hydrolase n=1 Tax=Saccharopolyspora galaxeae TaxID=2781241 RepID=UPI001F2D5ECA|nr:alpha/beta fold hydrolase [Saccharopolyspora sp. HNM0986]MBK0866121.1 alpha/beta fold hydrolase [Saccharopolyspora sp. HNM0986]
MTERLEEAASPYRPLTFDSGGDECHAWHFPATDDSCSTADGRPCVVMAHGLAGTKDSGLRPFAEGLAAAGLDVLAFDYRGFGASAGTPRQTVSVQRQIADYRAAMRAAAKLPDVHAQRLVLWGVSLAGGHVITAAAGRDDVAAVVSLTPLVDGLAGGRQALATHRPTALLRSFAAGIGSRLTAFTGGTPTTMPVVGKPGERAALSLPGCYEDYLSIAGPTWRNETDTGIGPELAAHRPNRHAAQLRCPWLVQIADLDRSAPPHAAAKAAFNGGAEVRHYPCDHFDVWSGRSWHEPAVAHQAAFLRRHLTPAT